MAEPDRRPPEVTVTVPGGDADAADLLEAGPAAPGSTRRRVALTAVLAVLVAGLVVATGDGPVSPPEPAEPPAARQPAGQTSTTDGVEAVARDAGVPLERFSLRLDLQVGVDAEGGPGDGPDDELVLLALTGQGFALRLDGAELPLALGPVGPDGSAFSFALDVAVTDCSVPTQAQRRLDLQVQRGSGPEATVRVTTASDVVRLLDRLVVRTCRPRG